MISIVLFSKLKKIYNIYNMNQESVSDFNQIIAIMTL